MKMDWLDVVFPPIGALLVVLLSWGHCRSVNGGRPLSSFQKEMIGYAFLLTIGITYSMMIVARFNWFRPLWIVFTVGWAVFLALTAWWRHRRQATPEARGPGKSISKLALAIPFVGLLICLVASAIEWEFVIKKEGHLVGSLLWTGGVAAMIALARRNRRPTVVTALRSFLGFLIIGALTQQSLVPLIAAVVIGVGLFLLERLWKKEDPSEIHFNFSGD